MKSAVFLDDVRIPLQAFDYTKDMEYLQDKWIVVKNYEEFITYTLEYFKNNKQLPEMFSFDHDLSPEMYENVPLSENEKIDYGKFKEKSGMECAKWLVDFCIDNNVKLTKYKVHSMNPAGKKNIESLLQNFEKFQKENA